MTCVFTKKEKFEHKNTQKGRACAMDTEIEIMLPQAKECQGLPATTRSWERPRPDSS